MIAKIDEVSFIKEYEGKLSPSYLFNVKYSGKSAIYSSNNKTQSDFVAGKEVEFYEEERVDSNNNIYTVLKLAKDTKSHFDKQQSRERARYSGMAYSYAKDLIVAFGDNPVHIANIIEEWKTLAKVAFDGMVSLDDSLIKD